MFSTPTWEPSWTTRIDDFGIGRDRMEERVAGKYVSRL